VVCSELGQLVATEWLKTAELRPNIHLAPGAFVVMPDHFHSILLIGKNRFNMEGLEHRYRMGAAFLEVDEEYLEAADWDTGVGAMQRAAIWEQSTASQT
jgi:hypothetical protein